MGYPFWDSVQRDGGFYFGCPLLLSCSEKSQLSCCELPYGEAYMERNWCPANSEWGPEVLNPTVSWVSSEPPGASESNLPLTAKLADILTAVFWRTWSRRPAKLSHKTELKTEPQKLWDDKCLLLSATKFGAYLLHSNNWLIQLSRWTHSKDSGSKRKGGNGIRRQSTVPVPCTYHAGLLWGWNS